MNARVQKRNAHGSALLGSVWQSDLTKRTCMVTSTFIEAWGALGQTQETSAVELQDIKGSMLLSADDLRRHWTRVA